MGSARTFRYVHTDHLGSFRSITDASGEVVTKYTYSAWGIRSLKSGADFGYRGHTGHEHLDAFAIINMNGRVYDPLTAQFFSPDPHIQAPNHWLNYNRYSYALNNPLSYTDPDGEFFKLIAKAFVFCGDLLSNLVNGVSNPVKQAGQNSSSAINGMSNCMQFPIYKSDNTLVTLGLDPFALGVSGNVVHRTESGTTVGTGFGYGFGGFNVNAGVSQKIGDANIGAGIGYGSNHWGWTTNASYKEWGAGYGQTYYGNATGPDGGSNRQTVGNASLLFPGGSFRLENDFLAFQGQDRWRTSSWELTVGDWSLGSYVYTNDPKNQKEDDKVIAAEDSNSKTWGPNTGKYGEWKYGQVYSSPLWIGHRSGNTVSRIGYNHWRVQDITQNGVHRHVFFGRQNYYTGYNNIRTGVYGYSGYYNPFSLYY